MTKMIVELTLVVITIIFAAAFLKRNPAKARKSFAVSFVLAFAVSIAFTIAQLSSQFKLLDITLAYTPLDMISLLAVVYWLSAVSANSTLFDKLIGE